MAKCNQLTPLPFKGHSSGKLRFVLSVIAFAKEVILLPLLGSVGWLVCLSLCPSPGLFENLTVTFSEF